MTITVPGIRERKKAATRRELAKAALRLVVERGLANVTVEEIAAEVDVSPRTFRNYFSSKEQAVVSPMADNAWVMLSVFCARPDDEDVWAALRSACIQAVTDAGEPTQDLLDISVVVKSTPSLLAHHFAIMSAIDQGIAAEVARRTGYPADGTLYPVLLAAAVGAALRSSLTCWLAEGGQRPLVEILDDAFTQLQAGLPVPLSGRSPAHVSMT